MCWNEEREIQKVMLLFLNLLLPILIILLIYQSNYCLIIINRVIHHNNNFTKKTRCFVKCEIIIICCYCIILEHTSA